MGSGRFVGSTPNGAEQGTLPSPFADAPAILTRYFGGETLGRSIQLRWSEIDKATASLICVLELLEVIITIIASNWGLLVK